MTCSARLVFVKRLHRRRQLLTISASEGCSRSGPPDATPAERQWHSERRPAVGAYFRRLFQKQKLFTRHEVFIEPRQVTLESIPQVARDGYAVKLSGINNELRVDAHAFQRLVHLFGADGRDVKIAISG